MKPIARQAPCQPTTAEIWALSLNRYQRDNLLWLLNCVGWPAGNVQRRDGLNDYNSGDWVGEIALMLGKVERWDKGGPVEVYEVDANDSPNRPVRFREVLNQ